MPSLFHVTEFVYSDTEEGDSEEVVSDVLSLSLNGEKQRINLQPALRMSFTHPKHVKIALLHNTERDLALCFLRTIPWGMSCF